MSPEEVARRCKLPLDRVRLIMAGSPPRLSEVRAISAGLRISKHFLAPVRKAGRSGEDLRMLFRSAPKASDTLDLTAERVSDYVEAALSVLRPRAAPPEWLGRFSVEEESYRSARKLAIKFRQECLGIDIEEPLLDLPQRVARMEGIVLAPLRESRFEGISLSRSNYFFVFVSPRFSGRMLFTLAHELGHVLAHRARLDESPIMEGSTSIGNFRKAKKSERFVDAFASCLLLPEHGVLGFLTVFRNERRMPLDAPLGDVEILLLARFYGVSFEVAAHRCEDLRLLPVGGAFSMAEHLRKHHKSPEKRADEIGLPAREPVRFPSISHELGRELARRIADADVSIGWASDHFNVSVSELMEMHRPGSSP
jgi:Zn-dependent peptidase ImmA (M78 family)